MLTPEAILNALRETLAEGRAFTSVSIIEGADRDSRARLLVAQVSGLLGGTLGDPLLDRLAVDHAQALMEDDRQEIVVADVLDLSRPGQDASRFAGVRLLFEIERPPLELIICGGGHVGQAVARAAALLDFRITVIDDRAEFASRDKFPDQNVRLMAEDFTSALRSLSITPATHFVIVTRGHRHDEICLREVIDRPARYIGMIGSRRRTTTIRERLRRDGVDPQHLHRVHAPIGLDIGALTPEEIAIAVTAEIVLNRRGGSGRPKSYEGPMSKAR